ncbi:dynein heavy chain-like protein PF11_0240 [Elysia marginata]|uniref:Dynein heavy chain-like protein PF11_0240 n=1 Tax=Elysia marginata TaxID=1093978 RepID=A0AAV4IX02_9GAST|nr:dynein heavy chain-like protein PF11_0240 [Elysia marginata]
MYRPGDRSRPNEGRIPFPVPDEIPDIYAGPTDFMEVGARGFLVTTLPKKEEFGIDDAVDLLRQTSIKLYGGYKAAHPNSKDLERKGYVKIDCLDIDAIKVHPHPGGEEEEEVPPDTTEAQKNTQGGSEKVDDTKVEISQNAEDKTQEPEEKINKETGEDEEANKETNDDKSDDKKEPEETADDEKELEETGKNEKEHEETNEDKKAEKTSEDKIEEETSEDKKVKETEEDKKDEKSTKKGEGESKEGKPDSKKVEEEEKRKDLAVPRMHSIYKFVAYRTEMRNAFFIKSDVPDPMRLAESAMELVLERKKVTGDAVCQLMPVLGVCQYDYQQLEVMCRRTLRSVFDETLEPKSFAVMLIDKLSEPGSEAIYETVRNTVWAVNPLAWMSSPISEPDVVLRFELIGSKLVLSCLRNYMSYRQYSPTLLVDMGKGEPEDDDGGWMSEEVKRQLAEKRLERERQREQERLREIERQKERAKKQEEAEAKRKAREEERKKREEERKERREKERKEREEKEKTSAKSKAEEKSEKDETSKKDELTEDESQSKETVDEDTPPSKRQKTDSENESSSFEATASEADKPATEVETNEAEELETSITEETPPPKKQKVSSSSDAEISKEEEELLLADDSKEEKETEAEAENEESEDSPQKATPKRTTRGARKTRGRASRK